MARTPRQLGAALAAAAGLATGIGGVAAHPHVWVATKAHVLFEGGAVAALRYTWLFDEMYTTNAVEGLDANKDGKLDQAELAELIKVNIEGLKEFEYFTSLVIGGEPAQFADPKDVTMEVVAVDEAPGPQMVAGPVTTPASPPAAEVPGLWNRITGWVAGLFGRSTPAPPSATPPAATAAPEKPAEKQNVLTLTMTLPLKAPVPAEKLDGTPKGLQFTVNDGQMFIWFEPQPSDGLTLGPGAPAGCRALFVEPEMDEQQKKLAEAFGRVGGLGAIGGPGKTGTVVCK